MRRLAAALVVSIAGCWCGGGEEYLRRLREVEDEVARDRASVEAKLLARHPRDEWAETAMRVLLSEDERSLCGAGEARKREVNTHILEYTARIGEAFASESVPTAGDRRAVIARANALLRLGQIDAARDIQRDAVIQYLELVDEFWMFTSTDEWVEKIKKGRSRPTTTGAGARGRVVGAVRSDVRLRPRPRFSITATATLTLTTTSHDHDHDG